MLLKQNKLLLLGAVAVAGVWLAVYFMFVQSNWAEAATKLQKAEESRQKWEKNFQDGDKLLPKPEGEKALEQNKNQLNTNLATLQKIEFGTKSTLNEYNEASAGSGDHKNYLLTKRTTLVTRAKDSSSVTLPSDLGMLDKVSDDPVALNLFRVAMIDSFVNACNKAGVQRVVKLQYFAPRYVRSAADDAPADETDADKEKDSKDKDSKDKEPKEEVTGDRLVQFQIKVQVFAPERAFGRLLYELQKPTEPSRGYLALRGFHVAVRDSASGTVDGAVAISALLSEKTVKDLGIEVKADKPGFDRRDRDPGRDY